MEQKRKIEQGEARCEKMEKWYIVRGGEQKKESVSVGKWGGKVSENENGTMKVRRSKGIGKAKEIERGKISNEERNEV